MRHSIELALSSPSLQLDLVPFPSLQQPLIGRPADIAPVEEVWPNEIDGTCNRNKSVSKHTIQPTVIKPHSSDSRCHTPTKSC